ncbi:MAG: acyl-CoA thioesterase [Balneolaceae bacterium]|nr:acyl-CoA thioesterase [Balneolaceae bacterium]
MPEKQHYGVEMEPYSKTFEVKWADMDPNRHMRHSVYNDYATQTRVGMFSEFGLSIEEISEMGYGPILFREETKFLREIQLQEIITVHCTIWAMRRDGSRWSIGHEIYREDGIKAAEIIVDGAWLALKSRKLGTPPDRLLEVMDRMPKAEEFEWIPEKESEKSL